MARMGGRMREGPCPAQAGRARTSQPVELPRWKPKEPSIGCREENSPQAAFQHQSPSTEPATCSVLSRVMLVQSIMMLISE